MATRRAGSNTPHRIGFAGMAGCSVGYHGPVVAVGGREPRRARVRHLNSGHGAMAPSARSNVRVSRFVIAGWNIDPTAEGCLPILAIMNRPIAVTWTIAPEPVPAGHQPGPPIGTTPVTPMSTQATIHHNNLLKPVRSETPSKEGSLTYFSRRRRFVKVQGRLR